MSCFYPSEARKLSRVRLHDVANTLTSQANSGDTEPHALVDGSVRRLTPEERERLMGFPTGHTDVAGAGHVARNRALGNSMAINCLEFIGERIQEIE